MLLTNYALPTDYRINPDPQDFAADPAELQNQFAIYQAARRVFDERGLRMVVDVGCGGGEKLIHFWPTSPTIGIERGANLEQCRRRFSERDWRDFDLEQPGLEQILPDWRGCLVICADVIEHLIRPDELLIALQRITTRGATCLISTPERDLCRGRHDRGPPANPCHVREWNLGEFFSLVSAFCPVRHVQLLPWRPAAERAETILVEI